MDRKELKDLLSKRLYLELQIFKDSKLQQEKDDIFKASYEIEIYVNLYEIFTAHTGLLPEETIRKLLNLNFGILAFIYQGWLAEEDSFYEELRTYACDKLDAISRMEYPASRKEGNNGTELRQTVKSQRN